MAYSPDSTLLAFGDESGNLRVWRRADPPTSALATLRVGEVDVNSVAFGPDGTTLAAGGKDNELLVWDVTDPRSPERIELPDSTFGAWVNATAFDPQGEHVVAASSDGELRVWNTADWSVAGTLPHPDVVTQVAFTEGGDTLVTVGRGRRDAALGPARCAPPMSGARVFGLTYAESGARLAAFSGGDTTVWDVSDPDRPDLLATVTSPDPDEPFSGAGDMTADGTLPVQGGTAGTVHWSTSQTPQPRRSWADRSADRSTWSSRLRSRPTARCSRRRETTGWSASGILADSDHPRLTTTLNDSGAIMLSVTWSPTASLLAANSSDGLTYPVRRRGSRRPAAGSRASTGSRATRTLRRSPRTGRRWRSAGPTGS